MIELVGKSVGKLNKINDNTFSNKHWKTSENQKRCVELIIIKPTVGFRLCIHKSSV